MTLKIVSLNMWRGALKEDAIRFLVEEDADIYCLQEVLSSPGRHIEKRLSSQGDLIYYDLLTTIKQALPNYECYFVPSSYSEEQGNNDDLGKEVASDFVSDGTLYGIATFVKRSVPVYESQSVFVHQQFRPLAKREPPMPRVAHCIRVLDRETLKSFLVCQFHGLWIPDGKHDIEERVLQALRVRDLIACMMKDSKEKVVLCGDFNVLPDSETFHIFDQIGLFDLVTGREFTDTRTSFYKKSVRYADYLLVTDPVEIIEFDVLKEPEVSDHRALKLICR